MGRRGMILDTCFLIDLQLEFRSGVPSRASAFLEARPHAIFCISVISTTAFLEGFANLAEGERLLRAYARLDVDSKVASQAAVFRRLLRMDGNLIGDFDILIAATAVIEGLPLVTRNAGHFSRIKELDIFEY
jgi:predicted nucleic acid-binding protein